MLQRHKTVVDVALRPNSTKFSPVIGSHTRRAVTFEECNTPVGGVLTQGNIRAINFSLTQTPQSDVCGPRGGTSCGGALVGPSMHGGLKGLMLLGSKVNLL